jgi:hypothetical protein
LNNQAQEYLSMMKDLNKPRGLGVDVGLSTRLHSGQIDALAPLYNGSDVLTLFLACGRKFGKTEAVCYILWKHALENPGAACYYVAPQKDHARKLIWDNRRIQRFLEEDTSKYVRNIENDTMTVRLNNGSFIQLLGSDNYAIANGLTPSIAVYDEMKHFRSLFHTEFAPNRAALGAKLVIIGTKPRPENRNYRQYNALLNFYKDDERGHLVTKTTFDNPINAMPQQAAAIKLEIDQLRADDQEDVVQLEFYSKVIPGGKRAIFPMLDKDRHMIKHTKMYSIIDKERDQLDFYCIADPGTTTVFGVLFVAYNRWNKKVYLIDEIYEEQQKKCSTGSIYPIIEATCKQWHDGTDIITDLWDINDDWFLGYDQAAAWFANEVAVRYDAAFVATEKTLKSKQEGISLIRDQLNFDMILISDKCEKTWLDMESYARKDNGDIPKEHDHTIDCLRYANGFHNYDITEAFKHIKKKDPMTVGRFRRMNDEEAETDWTQDIFSDLE